MTAKVQMVDLFGNETNNKTKIIENAQTYTRIHTRARAEKCQWACFNRRSNMKSNCELFFFFAISAQRTHTNSYRIFISIRLFIDPDGDRMDVCLTRTTVEMNFSRRNLQEKMFYSLFTARCVVAISTLRHSLRHSTDREYRVRQINCQPTERNETIYLTKGEMWRDWTKRAVEMNLNWFCAVCLFCNLNRRHSVHTLESECSSIISIVRILLIQRKSLLSLGERINMRTSQLSTQSQVEKT